MADTAAVAAGTTPAKRRSRGLPERRLATYMVAPSMILIAVVAVWPIIYAIWLSLHEYSLRVAGLSRWASPAGLGNYIDALKSQEFWSATRITFVFTICSVVLETLLGLAMALIMHAAFKGQGLLRTTVLVPWAVLTVVTAIMWKTIFDPNLGFVNSLLGTKTVWLGEEPQALMVMIFADVWKTAPFMALLLLAGLQVIPTEIYEAARVDGATPLQQFRHVTWPGIAGPALLAALLNALWTFREFDIIYASTRGGPAGATETLGILVYREAFESFRFGTAAAIGVLMLATATLFVVLFMRVLKREFA